MIDDKVEASEKSGDETPVKVVACSNCRGPVMTNFEACRTCGTPLGGTEFRYIAQREPGPDVPGLIKWWVIWSVAIFVLSGFSFGTVSSLVFALVSTVYLIRILRAVYH
jgi:hypothetical protein